MCDDHTHWSVSEPYWAAYEGFMGRNAPQPPSEPAADSGGSGSQGGRTEVEAVARALAEEDAGLTMFFPGRWERQAKAAIAALDRARLDQEGTP